MGRVFCRRDTTSSEMSWCLVLSESIVDPPLPPPPFRVLRSHHHFERLLLVCEVPVGLSVCLKRAWAKAAARSKTSEDAATSLLKTMSGRGNTPIYTNNAFLVLRTFSPHGRFNHTSRKTPGRPRLSLPGLRQLNHESRQETSLQNSTKTYSSVSRVWDSSSVTSPDPRMSGLGNSKAFAVLTCGVMRFFWRLSLASVSKI